MVRMFRVDCVRKGSDNYFKGLEDYVGKILELNTQAGVDSFGSVALFTPDKKDYWHFDNEWVTEISEQYNLLNPERKHESPLDKQVSGTHYKDCGIQPIEYIHANGLNYFEGNAVKYITRHRKKNGKADIEKAIHYLELMLELEYKEGK